LERLLTNILVLAALAFVRPSLADDVPRSNHTVDLSLRFDYVSTDSSLGSWPSGGAGKLRYDDTNSFEASRISLDYSGRLKPTLFARVVADYVGDGDEGLDIAEAFITWKPVPQNANRHQLRAGAMYPPFSYENTDSGWLSPYTISFSAINTWLGEEIRPLGVEWSTSRRIGDRTSPHQLNFFASAFYGNDPAATLLFWRGWSIHDRQTRLNDRLAIPPFPVYGTDPLQLLDQSVAPFKELDSKPGYYAGIEWRYASRVRAQLGLYDNRADPYAFSDLQWGWDTKFHTASVQVALPRDVGLIAQWMGGDTGWFALPSGRTDPTLTPDTRYVVDDFESAFVLLTRLFANRHRASLRYETFSIKRPDSALFAETDQGRAWTLAYRFISGERLTAAAEWLDIASQRDLWSNFYGLPRSAREQMLRIQLMVDLSL